MADEDGLASPFDDDLFLSVPRLSQTRNVTYVLALWDGRQVNLDLSHGQNIRGSRHVDKEICGRTKRQQSAPIDSLVPLTSSTMYIPLPNIQSSMFPNVPWTVAFAPAAVKAPIVPTIKYWNTKLLLLPCLLL